MKNLVFYFNPKKRKGVILKSFYYFPCSKKEEELGNLYLVAELTKSRGNYNNLSELLELIKNEYYKIPERGAEISFKQTLEKIKAFVEKEREQENQKWLEGLSLSFFSLTPDFSIFFSRKGNLSNFLIRQNVLFDFGAGQDIDSMIKGELIKEDKVIILNQDLLVRLREQALIDKLRHLKKPRELKKLFKNKKQILQEFFGVLLFVFVKKETKKIYFNTPKNIIRGLISILILALLLILGYYLF